MTAPVRTKILSKEDFMYLEGFATAFQRGQLKIPAKSKSTAHCAKMRLYRAAKKLLSSDELIRNYPDLFEARQETSVAVKEEAGIWYVVISRVDSTDFNADFRAAMEGATGEGFAGAPLTAPATTPVLAPMQHMPKDAEDSMKRMAAKLKDLEESDPAQLARKYMGKD